jgi:hypothetical protein
VTAQEITDALIADKASRATRKETIDIQAAIVAALRTGRNPCGAAEATARW